MGHRRRVAFTPSQEGDARHSRLRNRGTRQKKNVQVTHFIRRRRASVQLSDSVKDLYMQQSHVLKTKLSTAYTTDVLTNLYVSIEAFIRQVAKTLLY